MVVSFAIPVLGFVESTSVTAQDSLIQLQEYVPPVPDLAGPSAATPSHDWMTGETFPIDLPTALQLAGADNWNVRIARERITEACARYEQARAMWLPSLNFGVAYTHHEGEIQATGGSVIPVSRNSLFAGGGLAVDRAPLAGGAGGPARLAIDLSLADAIFEPLYQCQLVQVARGNADSVFNDSLYEASVGYYELVRAQVGNKVAFQNYQEAREVLETITAFVEAGKGADADISRLKVIVQNRSQQMALAKGRVGIASSHLATVLQLDPAKLPNGAILMPVDQTAAPVSMVDTSAGLDSLVFQAIHSRPEMRQLSSSVNAANRLVQAEHMRPLLPNINVGGSGGGFGGGTGSELNGLDGRFDFDVVLAWQLKNLGVGNRALRKERNSQLRIAHMQLIQINDQITNQVTAAWHETMANLQTLDLAQDSLDDAADAMSKTIDRIRGLQGDPLELIQSLQAMAASRLNYMNSSRRLQRVANETVTRHRHATIVVVDSIAWLFVNPGRQSRASLFVTQARKMRSPAARR